MLLIDVPRGDLSVKPEKSSLLHCCQKMFMNIGTLFTRSVYRCLKYTEDRHLGLFRDRPILSESRLNSFSVLRGCPSR